MDRQRVGQGVHRPGQLGADPVAHQLGDRIGGSHAQGKLRGAGKAGWGEWQPQACRTRSGQRLARGRGRTDDCKSPVASGQIRPERASPGSARASKEFRSGHSWRSRDKIGYIVDEGAVACRAATSVARCPPGIDAPGSGRGPMSTAGKVLTVLILLVMVGWIVMLSAVTQLNVNWHTRIAKQEADLQTAHDTDRRGQRPGPRPDRADPVRADEQGPRPPRDPGADRRHRGPAVAPRPKT